MKNNILILAFLSFSLSGCASVGKKWKELITGKSAGPVAQPQKFSGATYSQQQQLTPSSDRKYKRTTRKSLEGDAHLEARSGSLWVMEGQGAYLFSENTVRMIGDPLAINIEGEPKEQLGTKSDVIANLIKQLEDRRKRMMSRNTQDKTKKDGDKDPAAEKDAAAPAQQNVANGPTGDDASRAPASAGDSKNFNVKMVPTRVVERMVDGNYRVRGSQPFMIGSREYKVIVSGIVRAEDFNEQGINASQLLDPNFDIVSAKGAELRQ